MITTLLYGQRKTMKPNKFLPDKSIALLLDPDKATGDTLQNVLKTAKESKTDYIFA